MRACPLLWEEGIYIYPYIPIQAMYDLCMSYVDPMQGLCVCMPTMRTTVCLLLCYYHGLL